MIIKAILFTLFVSANRLPVGFKDVPPILERLHGESKLEKKRNYSQSDNNTGLYIKTFIDDNEVSHDEILRWEARRIGVVKKRIQEGLLSLLR